MSNQDTDICNDIISIGDAVLSYFNQRDKDVVQYNNQVATYKYDIELKKQERKREKQELKAKIKALKIQKELRESELQYLTVLAKCVEAETLKYFEVIQQITIANANYFQYRLDEISEEIFSTKAEMNKAKNQEIYCLKVNELNELRKERRSIDDKFNEINNNLLRKMQFARIDGPKVVPEDNDDVEDAEWEMKNEEENMND